MASSVSFSSAEQVVFVARITISQLSDNQSLEQAFQAVDKQLAARQHGG
ncbi:MAG: hypothetical protein ACO1PZ_04525 [Gammaproteobacteria bacterium]